MMKGTMKQLILTICVICAAGIGSFAQVKMKKAVPCEGIKVKIPKNFVEMQEEDIAYRYTTPKKPTKVYTNSTKEVDFDINVTNNFWASDDLELLKDFYKSSIMNSHKKVKFLRDEIVDVNKRNCVWLEFKSSFPAPGGGLEKHYTSIVFTVVSDRIVVFSYRTEQRLMGKWQKIATESLNSIKISSKLKVEKLVEQEVKGEDLKERETEDSNKEKRPDQKVSPRPNFKNPEIDPEDRKKKEGKQRVPLIKKEGDK